MKHQAPDRRFTPQETVTKIIAWATREARQRLMAATAANIRVFLAGEPVNVVNGGDLRSP